MQFKAHPTTYKGCRFRSRLEARWAAFFDLCGWKWAYEPFDLEGWAPDFALYGEDGGIAVLVEVKPLEPAQVKRANERPELGKVIPHAPSADCGRHDAADDIGDCVECCALQSRTEILICGLRPYKNDHGLDSIGSLLTVLLDPNDTSFGLTFDKPHRYDFSVAYGSYAGRITGDYDGNPHGDWNASPAESMWREAGNLTQWRTP